jgi:hypothetical protein
MGVEVKRLAMRRFFRYRRERSSEMEEAMYRFDTAIRDAVSARPVTCPIPFPAPATYYRPDQIREVPEELRGLVALQYEVGIHEDFQVNAPRFEEGCAIATVAETAVRDAFQCPPGTNIGFHADWKVIVVRPDDQHRYIP